MLFFMLCYKRGKKICGHVLRASQRGLSTKYISTKTATCFNQRMQKSISDCTTLKQKSYSIRRPLWGQLLLGNNRKFRLQIVWTLQNLTIEDWKNVPYSFRFNPVLARSN